MNEKDIKELRDLAEQGLVQFKERVIDKADVAAEIVAMSNTRGGRIIVGINDKTGKINAMSYKELQETTSTLGNLASENVVPSVLIDTENVSVEGGAVTVATIKEGINKPYKDNKGVVWVKNGSDKRKVFDNAELAEMMEECGTFSRDEAAVPGATIDDLDEFSIKSYIRSRYSNRIESLAITDKDLNSTPMAEILACISPNMTLEQLLKNLRFIRSDGKLTVAAMLLFGKAPQRFLPTITCKCISFFGNSVGGTEFRDKVNDDDMEGNLFHQFNAAMDFFCRNLHTVQPGKEFNTQGVPEFSISAIQELVINALVHRSLNRTAPVRIFIFDNRIEIHSPGTLPGKLTVEDVKNGISLPRNEFLFNNAIYSLPYTGVGTGIRRAIDGIENVQMVNDERIEEFIVTIPRSNYVEEVSNHQNASERGSDKESNQVCNYQSNHQKLTKEQDDIRKFCSIPRTSQEIMNRLGISNQSKNRQRHIAPLLEMGVLEMTNPDNPKDKNQKYRKK